MNRLYLLCALCGLAMMASARAEEEQQPDKEKDKAQAIPPVVVTEPRPAPAPEAPRGPISWTAPATNFSERVGPYNQPSWTTERPFSSTRAYVIPEGQMELEQWYRPRWKNDGTREDRILEEWAIGLPYHLQLDIYERWNIQPDENGHYNAAHEGVQIELRWAFADWDVIPLNPTIYLEWIQRDQGAGTPNKYEIKFLLAEEFFKGRLFWAGNFILEQETGVERETELAAAMGLSTPIVQGKLTAGIELWYRQQDVHGDRGNWNQEFLVGPTLQWRPSPRTFVTLTGFWGTTSESPKGEVYVILGWLFGKRPGPSSGYQGINPAGLGN